MPSPVSAWRFKKPLGRGPVGEEAHTTWGWGAAKATFLGKDDLGTPKSPVK